jgi:hypothetical protein
VRISILSSCGTSDDFSTLDSGMLATESPFSGCGKGPIISEIEDRKPSNSAWLVSLSQSMRSVA